MAKKGQKYNLSDEERLRRAKAMSHCRQFRKVWTQEEVKVCLVLIKENPDNLQHAFRLASEKIGKSSGAISRQYYDSGGIIYRFHKNRYLFSIFGISCKYLTKIFTGEYFGRQVKNNLKKGRLSL